ncbi:general stress protein [Pantoea sp. Aalb]|uniref:general stress protein n=1 Tax=Pantoea sp. Aalb TaxID=2576762 RepID=UPI0013299994|nr:stress-induced protein [Pantoea sp. Aalb]MXP67983.1 stress-induced protein [Pantoea sp. Aalb]
MIEHRSGSNHMTEDKQKPSEIGKKVGQNNEGNFKHDKEKVSQVGKKSGQHSNR